MSDETTKTVMVEWGPESDPTGQAYVYMKMETPTSSVRFSGVEHPAVADAIRREPCRIYDAHGGDLIGVIVSGQLHPPDEPPVKVAGLRFV